MHRRIVGAVTFWATVLILLSPVWPQEAEVEVGIANTGELRARDIIIKKGLSEGEVRALMRAWRDEESPSVAKVVELAAKLAVTEAAVANFLRTLDTEQVEPENLLTRFAEIADRYLQLEARVAELERSRDAAIVALAEEARKALEVGEYDQADKLLSCDDDASSLLVSKTTRIDEIPLVVRSCAKRHQDDVYVYALEIINETDRAVYVVSKDFWFYEHYVSGYSTGYVAFATMRPPSVGKETFFFGASLKTREVEVVVPEPMH